MGSEKAAQPVDRLTLRAPEPSQKFGFNPLDIGAWSERLNPSNDLGERNVTTVPITGEPSPNGRDGRSLRQAPRRRHTIRPRREINLIHVLPTRQHDEITQRLARGAVARYSRFMANPSKYTGVPGFNVSEEPNEPPPPSKSPLQRPFAPKTDNTTVVTLRGVSVPLTSDVGAAFVADLARNKERLLSDDRICEKYDITPNNWTAIAQSKAVRLAVNAEHERRTLNSTAAQESAAQIFMNSPTVMGEILNDKSASPRHRIEASKELRATARAGDEKT